MVSLMQFNMHVITVCGYSQWPDGSYEKCQMIIADGLSIGCPCCGVFRCREPLENNRRWFCAKHMDLHDVCAIVNCENSVVQTTIEDPKGGPPKVVKKKRCSLAFHQEIEKKHSERSTGP